MSGFRRCGRRPLRYEVKFSHAIVGDVMTETQDISETGIFVRGKELIKYLCIGDILNVQLTSESEVFEDTQLKVVRMTDEGIGLAFE